MFDSSVSRRRPILRRSTVWPWESTSAGQMKALISSVAWSSRQPPPPHHDAAVEMMVMMMMMTLQRRRLPWHTSISQKATLHQK